MAPGIDAIVRTQSSVPGEPKMRIAGRMIVVAGALAGAFLMLPAAPQQAKADPYRWCAIYSGESGGASNCGFVTWEQCRATILGMGGFCEPNQFYDGKPFDQAQPTRPQKRR